MVTREFQSDQALAGNEEGFLLEDPFEAEETLSLSDLPFHSDSFQWDDYSKEGQSSPSDHDNDDFFEFSSEDLNASTRSTVERDIIFCGKIINAHKESPRDHFPPKGPNFESNTNSKSQSDTQEGVFLPWTPNSFHRTKSTPNSAKSGNASFKKGQGIKNSRSLRFDHSVGNLSLMRSATKSRWYLFIFGMSTRLPTEMELSDIRSRQSRRGPPAALCPEPEQRERVNKDKGKRNKWLGRLLRSMGVGCGNSKHTNDVVKKASCR